MIFFESVKKENRIGQKSPKLKKFQSKQKQKNKHKKTFFFCAQNIHWSFTKKCYKNQKTKKKEHERRHEQTLKNVIGDKDRLLKDLDASQREVFLFVSSILRDFIKNWGKNNE